jgi:hypothetical protein
MLPLAMPTTTERLTVHGAGVLRHMPQLLLGSSTEQNLLVRQPSLQQRLLSGAIYSQHSGVNRAQEAVLVDQ